MTIVFPNASKPHRKTLEQELIKRIPSGNLNLSSVLVGLTPNVSPEMDVFLKTCHTLDFILDVIFSESFSGTIFLINQTTLIPIDTL